MSPYTIRDFRYDNNAKVATDTRVEEEYLYRLDQHCNEAKRKRQAFISQSKRYSNDESQYEAYLSKAEDVDMSYCTVLKDNRRIIDAYLQ